MWTLTRNAHRMRALIAALAFAIALPAVAQTAPSAYRYQLPPGWTQAMEGDIESLTPAAEPAGSAQLMLLAPKAASGDFRQQFDAERAALESFWGLRAPQAAPPQGGSASVGQYAAHFASYDSDAGPRYMAFMALGTPQKFGLLVFVASDDRGFNRLAPQAVEVFRSLSLP